MQLIFSQPSIVSRRKEDANRSVFREKLNGYVNVYSFMSQIMPCGDPALEMLYSFGRFLVPHLPLDRDTDAMKIGDEVRSPILPVATDLFRRNRASVRGARE